MPFKESSIVSQRAEFCVLALSPGSNVRRLCRDFGIGSATAYKWLARYRASGEAGLEDRSRHPQRSPGRTSPEVEERVLGLRTKHPCWGGRKLRKLLERNGVDRPPAASTITQILRRHGKLDGPGTGEPRAFIRFEHAEPNDLWQMDFKGHFAIGEGRCHPLTLLDDHSRYALELGACADERATTVRGRLERLFLANGLPRRILADNGSPWGTAGPERHTRLTVWLLDLGVGIVHGRPHHPQTQGKEERFHRTLKAELLSMRSFSALDEAQAAFDDWRAIYNDIRPHEALGMETPASRYRPSRREMPTALSPPEYESGAEVRKVGDKGQIHFKGRKLRFSRAFVGRAVALTATDTDGLFDLRYRQHVLAQVDLRQNIVKPFTMSPNTRSP